MPFVQQLFYDPATTTLYDAVSDTPLPIYGGARISTAVASTVSSGTSEVVLWSYTIPKSLFTPNSRVWLEGFWTYTNNANNKILKARFGGQNVIQLTATTTARWFRNTLIANRNSLASQLAFDVGSTGIYGNTATAPLALTVDTSNDVLVEFTGQPQTGGDSVTLEYASITIL